MRDRIVENPHRYQLIPVAGEENTYDIIAKPGTITEPGTPINKATLLTDATAALYGLTGEDATVDGALANITAVAQSSTKSYGNVVYTDAISNGATLTKLIAIGPNKKFGRCVIAYHLETSRVDASGIMVEFCADNTKSLMVGVVGNQMFGSARSRRHLGCISSEQPDGFGNGCCAGASGMRINELFIDGTNIKIVFQNTNENNAQIRCAIDWEVW